MKKKLFSILLAVLMLLTLLPVTALATTGNFDPCNGEAKMAGESATTAPTADPTWGNYIFLGWFDKRTGGTEVTENFLAGTPYYAHWQVSATNTNLVLTEALTVKEDGLYIGDTLTDLSAYGLSFTEAVAEPATPAVLTMNNAVIDTYDGVEFYSDAWGEDCYVALNAQTELTLELSGENTVHLPYGDGNRFTFYADYALTFDGDGKLNVIGGGTTTDDYVAYALLSTDDEKELTNNAELSVQIGDSFGWLAAAIECWGDLTNNGKISVQTGKMTGAEAYGIEATRVTVTNNGTITATAGESVDYDSCALAFSGSDVMNYGTITAQGGVANEDGSYGMQCHSLVNGSEENTTAKVIVTAKTGKGSYGLWGGDTENYGEIIATGAEATGDEDSHSYGAYAGELNNYGTLTAESGKSKCSSFGLYVGEKFDNSGTITATAGDAGIYSCGMNCINWDGEDFKSTNSGTIIATAGKATGDVSDSIKSCGSYGLWCENGILTNSGTITATADDATGKGSCSYGLWCSNLVNNATVTATAGNATGAGGNSYGVYCYFSTGVDFANQGNITNNAGAALIAKSGNASSGSYGVYCYVDGNFEGCTGIEDSANITNNGMIEVMVGTAGSTYGVYCGAVIYGGGSITSSKNINNSSGGAIISYGKIQTEGIIIAEKATVTGANESFTSGATQSLTQKDTTTPTPVIICFGPLFDPCNGEPIMPGAGATSKPAKNPTREGYTFDGWYDAQVDGNKIESGFVKGTIYYAHWREARSNNIAALLAIAITTVITVRSITGAAKLVIGVPMAMALVPQIIRMLFRTTIFR